MRLDADRSGAVTPREFLALMRGWGVPMTEAQCLHLLDPFDVDLDGQLDFGEFVKWVAIWAPPDDGADYAASWRPVWKSKCSGYVQHCPF